MKVTMVKLHGGVLAPVDDITQQEMTRYKTGEYYDVEIKEGRNPQFHKKMFVFFKFCFEYWSASQSEFEFLDERAQFDRFRKDLTILAGYYVQTVRLNGDLRIEAESLSFSSMSQSEFEACSSAIINAAMKHLFKGCDKKIEEKLMSFF